MKIQDVIEIAEKSSWVVTEETYSNGKGFLFSKFSPAGQDFNIPIEPSDNATDLIRQIKKFYDEFDIDYETYIWLDKNGHGKNGAPYHIKDILEDMEFCKGMVLELYNLLK